MKRSCGLAIEVVAPTKKYNLMNRSARELPWVWLCDGAHNGIFSEARFSKSPKLYGPEKPFVKFRPAYSVKRVFSYVLKGIKIKIAAKFRASRRRRYEDPKRIMSPVMRLKGFATFLKRAPGPKYEHNCELALLTMSSQTSIWRQTFIVFFLFVCQIWNWRKHLRTRTPIFEGSAEF